MSRHRRILHPTDFSGASGAAFKRAIALAKADKAQLFIAHVIAPPMPIAGEGYIPPNLYEDLEASARKYAEKKLAALQVRAGAAGVRAASRPGPRKSTSSSSAPMAVPAWPSSSSAAWPLAWWRPPPVPC
jgi:nucleotide-binding universal stress UspA family protein